MGMTREEFKAIAMGLYVIYEVPKNQTQFDVWYELLSDMDYATCEAGALAYSQTEHYQPTPANTRKKAMELMEIPSELSEGEAWYMVRKAIGNGIYGYEEEYAKLPESIQKAIGNAKQLHHWAIDSDFNEGVVQSQFLRSYRTVEERRKTLEKLPQRTREALLGTQRTVLSVEEKN